MERIIDTKEGHYTFSHYNEKGEKVYKAKKTFETDKEAIEAARIKNLNPKTIHKYVAYKCKVCHKWHVGNNGRELTDKDREHYRKNGPKQTINTNNNIKDFRTGYFKKVVLSAEQELMLKRNLKLN